MTKKLDIKEVRKRVKDVELRSNPEPMLDVIVDTQAMLLETPVAYNSPVFQLNMKLVERLERHESQLAEVLAKAFRCRSSVTNWGVYYGKSVSFWGHREDLIVLAELYSKVLKHMQYCATTHLIREGKKANSSNDLIYKKGLRQEFYELYMSNLSEKLSGIGSFTSQRVLQEFKKARLIREDEFPEEVQKLDSIVRQCTGIEFVTFAGFHIDVAREVSEQLMILCKMFPQVAKEIKWLSTCQLWNRRYEELQWTKKRTRSSIYAYAHDNFWMELTGISFNMKWASDYEKFSRSTSNDSRGFHPRNCKTIASVMTHEFGHHVDFYLSKYFPEVRKAIVDASWNKYRLYNWHEYEDSNGKKHKRKVETFMCKDLSKYALENDKEMFAEAFAEWIHSGFNSKSIVAMDIGNQVAKFFNLNINNLEESVSA